MDYFRHLGIGVSKTKRQLAREESPISDIDDTDGRADISIDAGIKAVLDAAKTANAANAQDPADGASTCSLAAGADVKEAGRGVAAASGVDGDVEVVKDEQRAGSGREEKRDEDVLMEEGTRVIGEKRAKEQQEDSEEDEVDELASVAGNDDEETIERREREQMPLRKSSTQSTQSPRSSDSAAATQQITSNNGSKPIAAPPNNDTASFPVTSAPNYTASSQGDCNPAVVPPTPTENDVEMQLVGSNIVSPTCNSVTSITRPHNPTTTAAAAPTDRMTPEQQQEEDQPEFIRISIKDANNYGTWFRCRPETKLHKIFRAYTARFAVDMTKVRFISQHGVQLPKTSATATVASVGLEDGDEVDVMLEQIGGCCWRQ